MTIKIFTDSSCDLPQDLIAKNNVNIAPLHVTFQQNTYFDRVNLNVNEFYSKMNEQEELPKTAAPSPYEFYKLYKDNLEPKDEGIVLSLSSQLSSTFQNAKFAIDMYKEDYPNANITAIDSKNASIGLGLIVNQTAKLIENGYSYIDITNKVTEIVNNTNTFIFLDTLENVIKGGRLDRVKGKIASVLSIKIIMKNSYEGSLDIIDKVRGSKNAIKRLVDLLEEYGYNLEKKILGIAHSNCEEKAIKVKKMIEERYQYAKIILTDIGPTIGTYAGNGGILISF